MAAKIIHIHHDELTDPGHPSVPQITLSLTLMALGDALLGEHVADELSVPRESARQFALAQLLALSGPDYGKPVAA